MILPDLTNTQLVRMKWAIDLTVGHLTDCEVPINDRIPIVRELIRELLEAFAKGEQCPNVPTEDYWREQSLKRF